MGLACDKAARLWLLAGLVPPVIDVEAWKKTQQAQRDPARGTGEGEGDSA